MEAEIGGKLPQTKKSLGLPEAGRGKEGDFGGNMVLSKP